MLNIPRFFNAELAATLMKSGAIVRRGVADYKYEHGKYYRQFWVSSLNWLEYDFEKELRDANNGQQFKFVSYGG